MPQTGDFSRFLCVCVDLQRYSANDTQTQKDLQSRLRNALAEAAAAAGLDWSAWMTQDQGDGALALVPAGPHEPRVIDDLVRHLDARLEHENRSRRPESRIRLRVAFHSGTAQPAALGFAGPAVVVVSRLVQCAEIRRALDQAPAANLAVIASPTAYEIVAHHHTTLRPDQFRRVTVAVKEHTGEAWIYVPGGQPAAKKLEDSMPGASVPPDPVPWPRPRVRSRIDDDATDAHGGGDSNATKQSIKIGGSAPSARIHQGDRKTEVRAGGVLAVIGMIAVLLIGGAGGAVTYWTHYRSDADESPPGASATRTASTGEPSAPSRPSSLPFRADWTRGMDGWVGAKGWSAVGGMLVSDGTSEDTHLTAFAPVNLDGVPDYVAQADIQLVSYTRGVASFGIAVRAAEDGSGGYGAGHCTGTLLIGCSSSADAAMVWTAGDASPITTAPFTPETTWHSYRVEVSGNQIRLWIDGILKVTATDNRFLTGSRVGFWAADAQISIRSFGVERR